MFLKDKNKILEILSYAIRAPSTHNSQPWLFKISTDTVEVYYDPTLFLPEADHESRDLYISMGCMLENLSIASEHFGFDAGITIVIDEQIHKIAQVVFAEKKSSISPQNELLFTTISSRVNARGIFTSRLVPQEIQQVITSEANMFKNYGITVTLINDKEKIHSIAQLTQQSMHIAYQKPSFRKEMYHWINSNLSKKKQGLPGYSLNMPLVLSLIIPVLIRFFNMGPLLGKLNFQSLSSAPLLIIFSGPNTKLSWVSIGRCAERLMLHIQSLGLQTSIYVGSLEMGSLYKDVQNITGLQERPQFLFAVGEIIGNHRITPRHPIEKKIIL